MSVIKHFSNMFSSSQLFGRYYILKIPGCEQLGQGQSYRKARRAAQTQEQLLHVTREWHLSYSSHKAYITSCG